MAGLQQLAFKPKKSDMNGSAAQPGSEVQQPRMNDMHNNLDDDEPVSSPNKRFKDQTPISPIDPDSYFNSFRSSRANSVYSLSRLSLSSQLSQLTSLTLPNAASLSTSISAIPTAPIATNTLSNAANQIKRWLQKASEVLKGLDAEDDVEWAAAGGREGLGELDAAIGKFESLIGVYVSAIENLQERQDISNVPAEQLKAVVDQMESILKDWGHVKKSLKGIKSQVELAMEWEELWNVVLGDIGLEMENLSRLVFEMEEARHKALLSDPMTDSNGAFDIQELDTIIEEGEKENSRSHHGSLPAGSPLTSPDLGIAPDDTRLLALFARMQPLRASLDFLPMTLSNFQARAQEILPSACQELESRRHSLEQKWEVLERDAEGLRKELGEDRWVTVFRTAGRKAQKMCESLEHAVAKLQDSIDLGTQHSNPPLLAKKVEAFEARKSHYGPSIEKVIGVIEKGVNDRLTVNGEILRLQMDTKSRWQSIKADIKDMDLALDDLTMHKNQQLRDSISSIMSMDRSATGSITDTPGSSPASSVIMGPAGGNKRDESPGINGSSRRSSIMSSRPSISKRYFSLGASPAPPTQLPRKTSATRSFTSNAYCSSRGASPSPYTKRSSATPTPSSQPQRPLLQTDNRPRWNSSPKVDYFDFGPKPRPSPFSTPKLGRKPLVPSRSPSSAGSHITTNLSMPSPLGRSSPALAPAPAFISPRPRHASGAQSSLGHRQTSATTPNDSTDWVKVKDKPSPSSASSKREIRHLDTTPRSPGIDESPSVRPRLPRPSTSMASSRRVSMLPLPKNSASSPLASGHETATGVRAASYGYGRESALGSRPVLSGKESGIVNQGKPRALK